MAENVVFLEPGDERAQKIAKAMGSQTANDILQILGEGPRSLTHITERLNIPMNTAKYHVENLLDAGLIAVEQTKYSIKGREVKIYTLTNQLLVVAPRQSNVRSLLLKYASLFGIVALGAILISAFTSLFGPESMLRGSANTVNSAPAMYAMREEGEAVARETAGIIVPNITSAPGTLGGAAKSVADTMAANATPSLHATAASNLQVTPLPTMMPTQPLVQGAWGNPAVTAATGPDPALMFFLGGALVIFVLLCYEVWVWKKHYNHSR